MVEVMPARPPEVEAATKDAAIEMIGYAWVLIVNACGHDVADHVFSEILRQGREARASVIAPTVPWTETKQ